MDENDIFKIDKYLFLNEKVELKKLAFDGLLSKYEISGNGMDIPNYLSYVKNMVFELIENYLIESNIKIQLILNVLTSIGDYGEENYREDNTYLHSITKLITQSNNLNEIYEEITDHILESFSSYEGRGSGWKFMGIQYLEISITKVKHFGGSSYIDLPSEIKNKKACVNVQNNNQECFKFSILAALHYDEIKEDHPARPSKYIKWLNDLNFNGIDFPVDLKDIDKFENQNPYRINVLGYENKEIYPLRISNKILSNELTINLLLINDKNEEIKNSDEKPSEDKINNHYVWIKDLSRLLSKQISKDKCKKYICIRCFNYFRFESAFKKHEEICKNIDFIKTLVPKPGTFIEFKNYKNMIKVPFVIYSDFETINKKKYQCNYCSELFDNPKIEDHDCKINNDKIVKTKKYQELIPCGFSFYIHSIVPEIKFPAELYRGPDAAKVFCEKIQEYTREIYKIYKTNKKIEMTEDEIKKFNSATECYICKKEMKNDDKVRDHCHLTGKYRGPAHNNCNLNLKEKVNFIPIFFHNLAGFDCHLFIRELSESDGNIECLAKNKEDYISFTKKVKVDEYVVKDKNGNFKYNPVYFNLRFLDHLNLWQVH